MKRNLLILAATLVLGGCGTTAEDWGMGSNSYYPNRTPTPYYRQPSTRAYDYGFRNHRPKRSNSTSGCDQGTLGPNARVERLC